MVYRAVLVGKAAAVVALIGGTLLVPLSGVAQAAPLTFTVTSTNGTLNDAVPGNGVCATPGGSPVCQPQGCHPRGERQPGRGHHRLQRGHQRPVHAVQRRHQPPRATPSACPTITEAVTINGSTQPNAATIPVRLDGGTNGIQIALLVDTGADGTVIKNLEVVRNVAGIHLRGNGATVQGSWIGTTFNGVLCPSSSSCGNSSEGVWITGSNNAVGGTAVAARNVISSNYRGVIIDASLSGATADSNIVQGNYIGTKPDGTTAQGNAYGVEVWVGGSGSEATGTTLGGSVAGADNLISGNTYGIEVDGGSGIIAGNTIGLDKNGARLANAGQGVILQQDVHDFVVGGSATGDRNTISGNNGSGLDIFGNAATTNNVVVRGNYSGTATDETTSATNRNNNGNGIGVSNGGTGLQILDNVIVKSGYEGISVSGCSTCTPVSLPGATIQGNRAGLDATGATAGNGIGASKSRTWRGRRSPETCSRGTATTACSSRPHPA